ncbi:MAG TPA: hypothetical protein VLC91_05880 [Spongiibacteraceae bacterium]|nr:hypothetical protein [Spongiibacteraceae bacterium]
MDKLAARCRCPLRMSIDAQLVKVRSFIDRMVAELQGQAAPEQA